MQNEDAVARFQREAQAASAVESAHIVEIFDSGITEDGQPYIVMELLRGEDLGHRIKRCGRLELARGACTSPRRSSAASTAPTRRASSTAISSPTTSSSSIATTIPNFAKILDFGISKVQRRGDDAGAHADAAGHGARWICPPARSTARRVTSTRWATRTTGCSANAVRIAKGTSERLGQLRPVDRE